MGLCIWVGTVRTGFAIGVLTACTALGACTSKNDDVLVSARDTGSHIGKKVKFTELGYGVAASPRVTASRKVRKGGGRRQIGKPYKVRGKWYRPREQPGYNKVGTASWYGPNFHGRLTANGEVYDQFALSAAHPTFPLPSYARVTNVRNGKSLIVRVNDRGPFHSGRIIDLSAKASQLLDYQSKGVAKVRVQYVGKAPLHGLDHDYLAASYNGGDNPTLTASRNASGGTVGPFDDLPTGSVVTKRPVVTKPVKPTARPNQDPFISELAAIKAKQDTGSTVSLRLRKQRSVSDR